jgi:cytochrome b6-f complex iron-sulfur subunit/menaquinol-cytochrome c reductase iron-sulfur subunit
VSEIQTGRRGALRALAVVGGAAVCVVVGAPGLEMLAPGAATSGDKGLWIKTVRLDSLEEGVPTRVAIIADARDAWMIERNKELGAVWLVKKDGKLLCLSAACPHLGCTVGHDATNGFYCPCHDSSFSPTGAALRGPSPRGMDPLATKIDDGYVVVDYRRFRQGTPERIEIG